MHALCVIPLQEELPVGLRHRCHETVEVGDRGAAQMAVPSMTLEEEGFVKCSYAKREFPQSGRFGEAIVAHRALRSITLQI